MRTIVLIMRTIVLIMLKQKQTSCLSALLLAQAWLMLYIQRKSLVRLKS